MKISARINGSISGATLLSRSSPSSPSSLRRCSLPLWNSGRVRDGWVSRVAGYLECQGVRFKSSGANKTIVQLCSGCPPRWFSSNKTDGLSRGRRPTYIGFFTSYPQCARNCSHAVASTTVQPEPVETETVFVPDPLQQRDYLLGMVDQYDDTSIEEHIDFLHDPYMRKYARANGPKITISDRKEDVLLQPFDNRQRHDPEELEAVEHLRIAVLTKLKRPPQMDLETIYSLYQEVPEPRISFLPARLRHQLLAALGKTERKDSKSMLRYFAVVADVKNAGFSLTSYEWNTAMSFATRYVGNITDTEIESALRIWRDMEHDAGVRANEVTFNILFDVASKAGNFTLSEMVYEEMLARGHTFSRYHHVSLIHFFGLKHNSSGVRAAYRYMVESGEIIDTIALNCVIASLLRCGEEDSAERIYDKMKRSTEAGRKIPDRSETLQKYITKVFMMFARVAKKHPDMHTGFQDAALLAPDLQTYRILVNWYGVRLGDLSKVARFLDEMKFFRVPIHGAIFLALFKSFHMHGGPGSDWSPRRLDSVWHAFLGALDSNVYGLHISTWMAMAALRAFARASSFDRERLLNVYEALRARWDLDLVDSQFMLDFLEKLVSQRDRENWNFPGR